MPFLRFRNCKSVSQSENIGIVICIADAEKLCRSPQANLGERDDQHNRRTRHRGRDDVSLRRSVLRRVPKLQFRLRYEAS